MNAMRHIVAIYAETHGLTKLLVLHCIMFGETSLLKPVQGNGIHGSE